MQCTWENGPFCYSVFYTGGSPSWLTNGTPHSVFPLKHPKPWTARSFLVSSPLVASWRGWLEGQKVSWAVIRIIYWKQQRDTKMNSNSNNIKNKSLLEVNDSHANAHYYTMQYPWQHLTLPGYLTWNGLPFPKPRNGMRWYRTNSGSWSYHSWLPPEPGQSQILRYRLFHSLFRLFHSVPSAHSSSQLWWTLLASEETGTDEHQFTAIYDLW